MLILYTFVRQYITHVWSAAYAPDYTRNVTIVRTMNKNAFYGIVKAAVQASH